MKKIIMLKTTKGCEDGFTVKEYKKDEHYEIADSLAATFIRDGDAFAVEELGIPEQEEEAGTDEAEGNTAGGNLEDAGLKSLEGAPENKAMKPAKNKKQG